MPSSSQYSSILFDWDGCLSNSLPTWTDRILAAFKKRNIEISHDDLVKHVLPHLNTCAKYGVGDVPEFITDVIFESENIFPFLELHDEVLDTLKTLKEHGKKHAVVTSADQVWIERACTHHCLSEYLDAVFTRDQVKKTKPDPEIIFLAMEKLASQPGVTCIVGDSEVDVLAGKAAGITTITYYPAENEQFYSYDTIKNFGADHIIRDFSELLEIVR